MDLTFSDIKELNYKEISIQHKIKVSQDTCKLSQLLVYKLKIPLYMQDIRVDSGIVYQMIGDDIRLVLGKWNDEQIVYAVRDDKKYGIKSPYNFTMPIFNIGCLQEFIECTEAQIEEAKHPKPEDDYANGYCKKETLSITYVIISVMWIFIFFGIMYFSKFHH